MWSRYSCRLPCTLGFLVLFQFTISQSFQFPDSLSDKWNSPGESKDVFDRGIHYESAIRDENPAASKRPPGCCRPELYLGFDNATADLVDDNHDIRRAQSRAVSIVDAPCNNYADLNVEVVQFKSAKFAKVTNAITISVWVNLQTISGIQPILLMKRQTGELRFEIVQGHVTWLYFETRPSLATFALLSPKPVVVPHLWTHIVAQYDARSNRAAVFVNGEEILQGKSNGESLEIAWSEFTTIGKYSFNKALEFKLSGYIDEFYIYYCALPEMVIQNLYQMCHMDGQCAPLRPDGFCGPDEQPHAVQGRCVSCFCMGRSQNCSSANLYQDRLEIQLKNESSRPIMHLVDVNGSDVSGITYTADHLNNEFVAHNTSKGTQYYWTLPKEFSGNKLSSYGGKLRYTVKYHNGNRITDRSAKNPSRYLRSLREIMNSRGFVATYNIDDVRDEETGDIDASGIDDPSLGDSDEVTSAPNTQSTDSRVTEMAASSLPFSTEINKEAFGPKVESEQTAFQANAFEHSTKSPPTQIHPVFFTSKRTRIPQQPTIDGNAIFTTAKIGSTATANPDEDIELVTDQDNKHTGRVPSTAGAKPEQPVTAAPPKGTFILTKSKNTPLLILKTHPNESRLTTTDRQAATATTPAMSSTARDAFTNGEDDTTIFVLSSASSTDGSTSEAVSTIPDASFTATKAFTDGPDEATRFVSSSAYSTYSPASEAITTIPETSSVKRDESTDGQDETTIAYTTDSLILKTVPVPDTFQPTPDTFTDGQGEATTFRPTSACSTIPVTSVDGQDETTTTESSSAYSTDRLTSKMATAIPHTSIDGQDETTTTEPSSAYSTEKPTSDAVATIPDTYYVTTDSDGHYATTTFVPSSAYTTERPPSETVTTISDMLYTTTGTAASAQDKTTTAEPSSAHSTDRPTSDTVATMPDTFSATTDSATDGEDETTTTKPSSAQRTERTASDTVTTIPDTYYTTRDTSTDGEDAASTFVPSSVYSTDTPTSDTGTTVPDKLFTSTDTSTDGQDETTTTQPLSAYSTGTSTFPTRTTIPDTFHTTTDAFTDSQDETTITKYPSVYSSGKLTSETVTTIPDTFHTTMEASTDDQDEKTTFSPSSAYSTERPTSEIVTSVPATSSSVISSTDGRDKTPTTEPLSAYSTDKPSILTGTTIPGMSRTTKEAFTVGQDETTTTEYLSVYSGEKLTSETVTTIPDTFQTIAEASTDDQDEKNTFSPSLAYSTERPTSETVTSVPATSPPVSSSTYGRDETLTSEPLSAYSTDKPTIPPGTTIPDTFRTTKDAFTDGQDETTTTEPPSAYSTNVPISRTGTTIPGTHTITDASTDDQDHTTTTEPPSAYSTDKPTSGAVTTTSDTLYSTTDTSTDGDDEITTTEPFSSYSTEKPLSGTMTTVTYTSSAATTSVSSTRSRKKTTSEATTSDVTTTTSAVTQTTVTPSPTPGQATGTVRLVGKDGTLVFHPEEPPSTGVYQTTMEVSLTEAKWRSPDGEPTSRDTFMKVLSEVQAIYVRASYGDDGPSATSLSIQDISLDVASPHNVGFGKALLVEQCECPVGYSGLSCEYCSPGYTRSSDGLSCIKCSCNEHSDICDQENGTCLECRHNTEGLHCDRCQSGYFGNALEGTPTDCQRCPCPLIIPPNQFSPTCFLDDDGLPTCDACPEGYAGRNCELCTVNFTGNPMIHYSKCELAVSELKNCDSRGSLNFKANNGAQKCLCKPNARGVSCGTCKPGFFNLQADNPQGCTPCFCNGVSNSCQSALLNRTRIRSSFSANELMNFTLVTLELSPVNSSDLFVNPLTKDLTFQSFVVEGVQNKILYWKMPQEYTGNKVTSYGGVLSHVISFVASSGGQPISAPDIILVGKDISLYHFKETSAESNEEKAYQVKLYEPSWTDSNGQEISRDQFIMALRQVEALLIRASYNTRMLQTTLREVSMDSAINDVTNQSRVTSVEQCACPLEYQGLSCESCKPGYYRSRVGPYLGTCIKCDCHGHSRDNYCDPETGECKNCQHNTGGFRCQNCLTGFYGNATTGKPSDCKPCPCPMTSPPNRFSPTCFMGEDGQPTCDACPPGYGGRRCDRCVRPYVGNPTEPGGNCKLEVDCGCDVRGSVNNSCDPVTRQCFCKTVKKYPD